MIKEWYKNSELYRDSGSSLVIPSVTNNNLTNIYHVVRPGQASYFGREHSETSLGR